MKKYLSTYNIRNKHFQNKLIYDTRHPIINQTRKGKTFYWSDIPVTLTLKCIGLKNTYIYHQCGPGRICCCHLSCTSLRLRCKCIILEIDLITNNRYIIFKCDKNKLTRRPSRHLSHSAHTLFLHMRGVPCLASLHNRSLKNHPLRDYSTSCQRMFSIP